MPVPAYGASLKCVSYKSYKQVLVHVQDLAFKSTSKRYQASIKAIDWRLADWLTMPEFNYK